MNRLTLEAFERRLDRLGPDLTAWHESERQEASDLLASDADARALLAAELRVRADWAALPELEPSAALRRRVFEVPAHHPPRESSGWLGFRWGSRSSLAALTAVGGVVLGLGALSGWAAESELATDETAVDETAVDETAVDAESAEWEALTELAFADTLPLEWP